MAPPHFGTRVGGLVNACGGSLRLECLARDTWANRKIMRRSEALTILKAQRAELARRFGVSDLTLFGSVPRDEATSGSDVDVLVSFDGLASFDRFMDVKFFLEEKLSARVDLVTRAALRPRVRITVDREAIRVP
jgi:uncharacterized protein